MPYLQIPVPIPDPIPVPEPGSFGDLDISPLWSQENLEGMVAIFQSVFILARQNYIITAFVVIGMVAMAGLWIVYLVSYRDENV